MARQLRKRVVVWETWQIWQKHQRHWICLHEIEAIPLPAHFYYSPSPKWVIRSSASCEDNLSSLRIFPWIYVTQCNWRWPGVLGMFCCSSSLSFLFFKQSVLQAASQSRSPSIQLKFFVKNQQDTLCIRNFHIWKLHCFLFPWINSGFIKILTEFMARFSVISKGIGLDSVFLKNISVISPLNKVDNFPVNCISIIRI